MMNRWAKMMEGRFQTSELTEINDNREGMFIAFKERDISLVCRIMVSLYAPVGCRLVTSLWRR